MTTDASTTSRRTQDPKPTAACFLTTATVHALGMPDDCRPLELARFLRDEKMTSRQDTAAVALYYRVAPTIVARSTHDEWHMFWEDHMRGITALLDRGEYQLAKELYTFATAKLIHAKATKYADVRLVDDVYDYGLKGFAKSVIPYPIRYVLLKIALIGGLAFQSVRLGLAKRRFAHLLA